MDFDNSGDYTVFVGNLDNQITEELLFELFLQAGPLKRVRIPIDHRTKRPQKFGFVTFKHICSVDYAVKLFNGIQLFNSNLNVSKKKKKDFAANGNGSAEETINEPNHTQQFQGQCQGAFDMQQGYAAHPMHSMHAFHGDFRQMNPPNYPVDQESPMSSTSQQMRHSRSFHNSSFHSPAHKNSFHEDDRVDRHINGRHDSPHHHRQSPSASELKRSRSYNSPKHTPKNCNERRFMNREESGQRQPSRNDSRRVVARGRQNRHSPYERAHRY